MGMRSGHIGYMGVINVIYGEGREMIPPLMASGKINVLGLIGTSKTANAPKKLHPSPNRLRCVLGLEAKDPALPQKLPSIYGGSPNIEGKTAVSSAATALSC